MIVTALTDKWLIWCYPKLGYSKKTHSVSEKARNNGIYKWNSKYIERCLNEGYDPEEIERILESNKGQEIQWLPAILPLPKPDGDILLEEGQIYSHPDLLGEDGSPLNKIERRELFKKLLSKCSIALNEELPEAIIKREEGAMQYLIENYTLDEIFYMAEECEDRRRTLHSLLDLQALIHDARDRIEDKRALAELVKETLRIVGG
jgi:hypothetical protein